MRSSRAHTSRRRGGRGRSATGRRSSAPTASPHPACRRRSAPATRPFRRTGAAPRADGHRDARRCDRRPDATPRPRRESSHAHRSGGREGSTAPTACHRHRRTRATRAGRARGSRHETVRAYAVPVQWEQERHARLHSNRPTRRPPERHAAARATSLQTPRQANPALDPRSRHRAQRTTAASTADPRIEPRDVRRRGSAAQGRRGNLPIPGTRSMVDSRAGDSVASRLRLGNDVVRPRRRPARK